MFNKNHNSLELLIQHTDTKKLFTLNPSEKMTTSQYMSLSLQKLSLTFNEFKNHKKQQNSLLKYHTELLEAKIKRIQVDKALVLKIYDYIFIIRKFNFDEKFVNNIKALLIHYKILEARALALDLVCDDYYSSVENCLRPPDSWMVDICDDLLKVLDIEKSKENASNLDSEDLNLIKKEILTEFIREFLNDSECVFLSKQKFKSLGNQLVLNFAYFCNRMSKYVSFDCNIVNKLHENIEEGERIELKDIMKFLGNYLN